LLFVNLLLDGGQKGFCLSLLVGNLRFLVNNLVQVSLKILNAVECLDKL
jgi:hypothetical protein